MKRGTKTKPTELQLYQGNPGHKTKAELTDSLKPDVIRDTQPPQFLDQDAAKEWKRVVPTLIRYQVVTELDRNTLALYCQSWSDYLKYSAILEELGATYETQSGQIKARPEVMMRRNAWLEVIKVSAEFGFTPSARAGMQLNMMQAKKSTAELLDELVDEEDDFS